MSGAVTLWVNQPYILTAEFFDVNKQLADPSTVTFTKMGEDGTTTTVPGASLTHAATGTYTYTTSESTAGDYVWEASGTGTYAARDLTRVKVRAGLT